MSTSLFSFSCFLSRVSGKNHFPKSMKRLSQITEFRPCSTQQYRSFIATRPFAGSFLQSAFWGQFKQMQNWQPHYFCGKVCFMEDSAQNSFIKNSPKENFQSSEREFALLVLSRSLLPRPLPALASLAYIPFGPVFWGEDSPLGNFEDDLDGEFGNKLGNGFAQPRQYFATCRLIAQKLLGYIPLSCFFVRMDSHYVTACHKSLKQLSKTDSNDPAILDAPAARDMGFLRSIKRVQVPTTIVLDLRHSEEQLLAQMHKKHRYNIRLAQKKKVEVRQLNWQEGLETWYQLYQITANRDKIGIHKLAYYQNLFELLDSNDEGRLFLYLAYSMQDYTEKITLKVSQTTQTEQAVKPALAGIIVLHYRKTATYLYGASSNESRELMPNYLLQWQAICDARAYSLQYYDFFGVPSSSGSQDPLHGLYRFKVGFGGYLLNRSGAWDLPYSHFFYGIYRLLERGRKWVYYFRHRR